MELNRSMLVIHTGKGVRGSKQCTKGPTGMSRKQASVSLDAGAWNPKRGSEIEQDSAQRPCH